MDKRESQDLIEGLVELVLELTFIGNSVRSYRRDCSNLTRRIKVLASLFEELRETGCRLPAAAVSPFRTIYIALCNAKDLLQECRDGSQFVLTLDREKTFSRFRELTGDLSRALDSLPLDSLDISDEVHELVELVHAQLKRAKGRVDSQDEQLFQALSTLLTCEADGIDGDCVALQKVAEKLHLQKETSWKQELKALEGRRGAVASRSEEQCLDHMINVLKQIQVEDKLQVGPLLLRLASDQIDVQRGAAEELRLLAKASEHRLCIAESGAIPILVSLLSTRDLKTQEHAVTALLNLSIINESNKRAIVSAGAIYPIVEILKHGSMEARENSAATLFSLSALDEYKVTIGNSGAIPALVVLLQEGQSRGKKDAATALFAISIHKGNKAKVVRSGIVPPLVDLLFNTALGMVDDALSILAVLAMHLEGCLAIGQTNVIPILVDLITNGTPRNKENGASVLLSLCTSDDIHATTARNLGAAEPLTELLHLGTSRAKRKARELLAQLNEQDSIFIGSGRIDSFEPPTP